MQNENGGVKMGNYTVYEKFSYSYKHCYCYILFLFYSYN